MRFLLERGCLPWFFVLRLHIGQPHFQRTQFGQNVWHSVWAQIHDLFDLTLMGAFSNFSVGLRSRFSAAEMASKARAFGMVRICRWVESANRQSFDLERHCPEMAVGMSAPNKHPLLDVTIQMQSRHKGNSTSDSPSLGTRPECRQRGARTMYRASVGSSRNMHMGVQVSGRRKTLCMGMS